MRAFENGPVLWLGHIVPNLARRQRELVVGSPENVIRTYDNTAYVTLTLLHLIQVLDVGQHLAKVLVALGMRRKSAA